MVMVFHFVGNTIPTNGFERAIVGATNYGSYGVELFFILSGFLITGILYDAHDRPHPYRNFFMRRLLRIFPLYYGVLILVFFVAPLIPQLRGATLDYLLDRQGWAWLYAVNVYIAKQGNWSFSYLDHFWSLAVEEQFYVIWPSVVILLARRPRTLLLVSIALAIVALLARLIGVVVGLSWWTTYVLLPFRFDGLALGAFLAVAARQPEGLKRLVWLLPRVAAIAGALLATTFVWATPISHQGLEMVQLLRASLILTLLACLLVWTIVAPAQSSTSRFFSSRFMVYLGTYSYGIYVYHHFISYYLASNRTELKLADWIGSHTAAVAVQATLGALASLAFAYVSYEIFEKRFLNLKRSFQMRSDQVTPASRTAAIEFLKLRTHVEDGRRAPSCVRYKNASDEQQGI